MNNKYRGKHIETGEWVYGYLIGDDVIVGEIVEFTDEYFCTEFWYKVDPETVGQYAGSDLYDGDIVVSNNYPIREEDGYVGVIEHDDGVFWLTRRLKNSSEARGMSDGIADYLYEHKDTNLKRIGNIYDNGDLLLAPKEGAEQ